MLGPSPKSPVVSGCCIAHGVSFSVPVRLRLCGNASSWSIFNKPSDTAVWKSPGANAQAFMIAIGFYGLGTILTGNWIERMGAREPRI